MRPVLMSIFAVLFVLCPGVLHAKPSALQKLQQAEKNLKSRNYRSAISSAGNLLAELQLDTVEEIIAAHRILGVAYCETGEEEKAVEHFEALLTFSSDESVSDLVATKPCEVLFERLKSEKLKSATPPPGTAAPQTRDGVAAAPETQLEEHLGSTDGATWLRYVPFGVGQFTNHQNGKGTLFLTGETVAFGSAVAFILLFKSEKSPTGTVSNPQRASVYRNMYWGSLGVGAGLAVWGIVDAVLVHRGPRVGVSANGPYLAFEF